MVSYVIYIITHLVFPSKNDQLHIQQIHPSQQSITSSNSMDNDNLTTNQDQIKTRNHHHHQPQQQHQLSDYIGGNQNQQQQQQQIKSSNRNQIILTGVRLSSDPNVLIDFSEINALKQFSEPMEIVAYKDDEVFKTGIRKCSDDELHHRHDVEMMYEENLMKCNRNNGQAVRPTTLNLTGPKLYKSIFCILDIFF